MRRLCGRAIWLRSPAGHGDRAFSTAIASADPEYAAVLKKLMSLESAEAAQVRWRQERLANRTVNLRDEVLFHMKGIGVDLDRLSAIHVAGTKGKGSVCQFAESLLRRQGFKTGTFVSPHLIEPRERIRIAGRPIDRRTFVHYFNLTHSRLLAHAEANGHPFRAVPPFFRFLTCMSFLVFQEEAVDVAVVEDVLGPTLTDIAFEKAGIMKAGVPCFTVAQLDEGQRELERQAALRPSLLTVVAPLVGVVLGMQGAHQLSNAALGLALARYWMAHHDAVPTPCSSMAMQRERVEAVWAVGEEEEAVSFSEQRALHLTTWRGRAQIVPLGDGSTMFLDGAHTAESCQLASQWFDETVRTRRAAEVASNPGARPRRRVLFCNFKPNKQLREMMTVLTAMPWDLVVFTGSVARKPDADVAWQLELQAMWQQSPGTAGAAPLRVARDFAQAVEHAQALLHEPADVFVTGSLYLTGAALEFLGWDVEDL